MELKKLIEEINRLTEDELIDEFDTEEINSDIEKDITSELNARTKISRALDVLKEAIEDFKDVVLEELDLFEDSDLSGCLECLDDVTDDITSILSGGNKIEEKPEEIEEPEVEDDEEQEDIESEDERPEVDFDKEAELNLFDNEEE